MALPTNVSLLENARNHGLDQLGGSGIESVYKAALIAGTDGLAAFLGNIPGVGLLWGNGDEARGVRLVELWSALVAQVLLGGEKDQNAVADGVARSFATLFLKSDERALQWFLRRFRIQLDQYFADQNLNLRSGTWIPTLIYWRSSEILGQETRLAELTFPVNDTVETLVARGFAFPPFEDVIATNEFFMSSCQSASEALR